eukprot:728762-Amphidinium_carterae.1
MLRALAPLPWWILGSCFGDCAHCGLLTVMLPTSLGRLDLQWLELTPTRATMGQTMRGHEGFADARPAFGMSADCQAALAIAALLYAGGALSSKCSAYLAKYFLS